MSSRMTSGRRSRHLERLGAVLREVNVEALRLELLTEYPPKEIRVVDHQDGLTHGRSGDHDAHRYAFRPAEVPDGGFTRKAPSNVGSGVGGVKERAAHRQM